MISKKYIIFVVTLLVVLIALLFYASVKNEQDCKKSGGHMEGLRFTRHCVKG